MKSNINKSKTCCHTSTSVAIWRIFIFIYYLISKRFFDQIFMIYLRPNCRKTIKTSEKSNTHQSRQITQQLRHFPYRALSVAVDKIVANQVTGKMSPYIKN